ncbi:phycobiliprotein lyase [Calothrix sp. 336/3]|uniref:phycobiliprotein lyase n=1 Tax=Calothrix sp. 336/3 TaxID=1337936 RepID=UPI0004E3B303|nr:phycobiliprotein lyase [Calothrix sp. 336/3]AKG20017.1 chorismate-binding protein [Calothrix sp. 336/3]
MNIQEFFELSAGKWFSHRTSHHHTFKQSEDGKSTIIIENLTKEHPEVIRLCQKYDIAPQLALCGAKVSWDNVMELSKAKRQANKLFVVIPDENHPQTGKLIEETNATEQTPVIGKYELGSDEAFTITIEQETITLEERLWFASPNLRMRVSVIKCPNGFSMSSFSSEIRMGGTAPAKTSEAANTAAN